MEFQVEFRFSWLRPGWEPQGSNAEQLDQRRQGLVLLEAGLPMCSAPYAMGTRGWGGVGGHFQSVNCKVAAESRSWKGSFIRLHLLNLRKPNTLDLQLQKQGPSETQ